MEDCPRFRWHFAWKYSEIYEGSKTHEAAVKEAKSFARFAVYYEDGMGTMPPHKCYLKSHEG